MTDEARATMPPRAHPAGPAGLADAGRCLVMGVVNVTPDSFSDGGAWFETGAAVSHGLRLAAEGADIVDTTRAAVAEFALGAGARMVNDVSGGRADPRLPRLVAEAGVPYAIMHSRGPSHD